MKTSSSFFLTLCCLLLHPSISKAVGPLSLTLAGALDQPGWTVVTGGDAAWFPQAEEARDGEDAARSGNVGDSQESWAETTIQGPGTLRFWWKVSSEEDFDFLEFHINSLPRDSISGTIDWNQASYQLGDGIQTVRWLYTKDSSISDDHDCGWVDQVTFEPDDSLTISPEGPWEISAFSSLPISASRVYTLSNEGEEPAQVSVTSAADWLDLAANSFTVGAGDSLDLEVTVNAEAEALAAGPHEAQLVVDNLTTGLQHFRDILLTILPPPGQTEITDSIAPGDDYQVPFGEISVGTTRNESIRIRNTHPENNLLVERIHLRPVRNQAALSMGEPLPPPPDSSLTATSLSTAPADSRSPGKKPPVAPDWSQKHGPDTILVRFRKTARAADRLSAHHVAGGRVVRAMKRIPLEIIRIPEGASPRSLVEAYQKHPHVEYAEPDYLVSIENQPNDPRFNQLWALNNSGQSGGLADADVSALDAWTWTRGSESVVVAVIDTGIDYTHPDLAANVWVNPAPTFGDVHGARWTNGDGSVTSGDPMDDNGHGTHVSGTIGAVGNNGIGITGVNWTVRIMGLKFLTAEGFGSTSDAIAALEYAIENGAHLTNNSWGGGGFSQALKDMIEAAGAANQLFVASAGNAAADNNITPSYPASFELDNILAVASSDHSDERSSFSNYGDTTVHLAAPGSAILSTIPGGGYDTFSGTSMAAPHVAGVAGLLLSLDPSAEYGVVKQAILEGVTPLPQWEGLVISGGRLSAAGALANIVKEYRLLNIPELPVTLPPGRSMLFEVVYEPADAGVHQANVVIDSQNIDHPSVEVFLSGSGAADPMIVSGPEPFAAEGYLAGPFTPNSKTYTIQNSGAEPLSWSASSSVPWLTVEPLAGALAPGEEVGVEVAINATSESLAVQLHRDEITFVNSSSGLAIPREIQLNVLPWPGTLSVTDSISPEDDLNLPFDWLAPGNERFEAVTLTNTHDTNTLIIDEIRLLGGYRENFDRPYLLGWDPRPAERWQLISGDRYEASLPPGNTGFMQSTYLEEVWYDAAFKVKLWRQGDVGTAAVLLLRASPDFDIQNNAGSAILIGFSGDGHYYVARYTDGALHWLQPWSQSSALITGTAPNVVVANIHYDRLRVFANGSLLWSGTAGGIFQPGRFGLAGYTSAEAPTSHRFDHVHIREPLLEDAQPLTLSQSWQNTHPASENESHAILQSRPMVPMMPAKKQVKPEPFGSSAPLTLTEAFRLVDLPQGPVVIAPNESFTVPVRFSPAGEGNFTRSLRILSKDPDRPEVNVALSGASELDPLRLFSLASVLAQGQVGGPFTPATTTIGLFNGGAEALLWQVASAPAWLAASITSGTLEANASVEISVSTTDAANQLTRGRYTSSIQIVNTSTGFVRTIPVTLEVRPTLCDALNACGLTWTTGGSAPWFGQEAVRRRRETAAQSGRVGDDSESWVETTVIGPGRVSFWWMVSSEPGYDFLEFHVNGERKAAISGETTWDQKTYQLAEGTHTLRWKYKKDFSWIEGLDTAWLDEVLWTPTAPERVLAMESQLSFGVVPFGGSAARNLTLKNAGDSTLLISSIALPDGFSGNWSSASIAPGNSRDLLVTFSPDSPGHHSGILKINSNATSGPTGVDLSGVSSLGDAPVELNAGQLISGLSGAVDDEFTFFIKAPPHRSWMEIRIFGGIGDADLYVRHGSRPTQDQWDFAPYQVGNNEVVFINQPLEGIWYFLVHGFDDFADVSVSAHFADLTFGSWAQAIGLPPEASGIMDRHGPLGITALEGYAFGRDPRLLNAAHLPRLERVPEDSDRVRLIYQVQRETNDISMTIESSFDLVDWNPAAPVSEAVLSESGGVEVREALFELGEKNALFIRATVQHE